MNKWEVELTTRDIGGSLRKNVVVNPIIVDHPYKNPNKEDPCASHYDYLSRFYLVHLFNVKMNDLLVCLLHS